MEELHLFMMCKTMRAAAARALPAGFHVRHCQKNELEIWKAMPFDTPALAQEYREFMTQFYETVYAKKGDLFFKQCLFVCDRDDRPVGTCFAWKAYESIATIHWFKVQKDYEGRGIGRALLSIVMNSLAKEDFPLFLHTHPTSYRAIKLYSDFGFSLLSDPVIGNRKNDLQEGLLFLKEHMLPADYERLEITEAPPFFLQAVSSSAMAEF